MSPDSTQLNLAERYLDFKPGHRLVRQHAAGK